MPPPLNRRRFLTTTAAATTALLTGRTRSQSGTGTPTALTDLDLTDAADLVQRREVSPIDLTRACLERIDALNPRLNAFITVTPDIALDQARAAERELAAGHSRGPLHGIPLALKDNIDTAGIRTTAAARAFADRVPATDAEVVRRLKAAGAVLLGKGNMDECAYGVSTTTGAFGAAQNPWKAGYIAGGSSGGPAAAVAARLCYGALGTDTGGSIRQPAAYCGVAGLMPTYGRVSTRGVIPLSWSLDHVGPLCRSAADTALVLQAIAGYDAADPVSRPLPVVDYPQAIGQDTQRLRLGKPAGDYYTALDPDVQTAIHNALAVLEDTTAGIEVVELPPLPRLPVIFVEANRYFAPLLEEFPDGFSASIRDLVQMGARISAAAYAGALRELVRLRREVQSVFAQVDLLVTPTTPDLPMTIEQSRNPGEQRGPPLSARNTTPFNLYGLPTISVPCGFSRTGLPIGLQISGAVGTEGRVMALAQRYEDQVNWRGLAPPLAG
jgi:aspartyl-tRNA(Asn)/glutamyl-tRNA(Gln) amidotransferase subunit A